MPAPSLQLEKIVSKLFEENAYVAWLAGRQDCLVIDPGLEPHRIVEVLDRRELVPAAILNTHGHSDHIAGNRAIKQRWPECPLLIGHADAPKLTDPKLNLSAMFGARILSPPADRLLAEGDRFEAAGFVLDVHEIPGHSLGHVVFVWSAAQPVVVFAGDVLFAGSVGRCDLPGGSFEALAAGIRRWLFTLPEDTIVYPGHGEPTTIGREKRTNPYVGASAPLP